MAHPSLDEIASGRCAEHLARCDSCRRLASMIDVAAPDPAPDDDLDRLPAVADGLYVDWEPLADARGGMGRVFRARDRRLGRHVAIKQVAGERSDGERAVLVRRFEREARLTARLQHPSIVGIYEAGRLGDGEPFYAMPLLRGVSLTAAIGQRPTLGERLGLLPHVLAVCDAVAYAHGEGIVHRDLKPDNVIIGASGETVVIDWGLAKDLRDVAGEPDGAYRSPPRDGLTQLGVGTAHYMPPEQAAGEEPDARADVYALGATLYHALAGAPPYDGRGAHTVRGLVFDERPRPLTERVPDCPRELCDIVERAMAPDKAARFASARALADELRRFQTGQLLTSRRYTLGELVRHFARRHRTALRISAVAAALVLVIVAAAFVRVARERDRAERAHQRAERALRRAQGVVASRTAAEPARRLDAILLGLGAVGPELRAHRPVAAEALQGLVDALTVGPPLVPLEHDGVIKHVVRSGDRLLGVDDARALVVWDAVSGRRLARWPSTLPQPEQPAASPDGRWAVVCGFDPVGEVFALATGAHRTFEARANLEGCTFLPDGRLLTAADEVVVRDPDSLAVVERFPLPGPAQGLAVSPGGAVAVTALGGGLWLWRPGSAPRLVATGLPLGPRSAFSPDDRVLYQVGADQQVRAFDLERPDAPPTTLYQDTRMRLTGVMPRADGLRVGVGAFDVDGERRSIMLAAGAVPATAADGRGAGTVVEPAEVDGAILGWVGAPGWPLVERNGPLALVDAERGGTVLALDAHPSEAAVLVDGDRLVTASIDGAAYLWDLTGGADGGLLLGHTGEIVALTARGDALVSAGEDGEVRVWGAVDGRLRATIPGEREVSATAWLGDDALAVGDLGGTVRVLGRDGGVRARVAGAGPIAALAGTPDGRRLAIGGLDGTLLVRDASLGAARPLVVDGAGAVTALAWSPDGARLVSGHVDGSTRLWDPATGALLATRPDPSPVDEPGDHEGHLALAFTVESATVLAVRPAGQTLLLAAADLAPRGALDGRMLAVTPAGDRVLTALGDGAVLVYPLAGGAPRRLVGRRAVALAAAVATDGTIAIARIDGAVELWPPAATEPAVTVAPPGLGPATAVTFVDERLAVGHASGALRLYPTTPAATTARACAVAARFGRAAEVAPYCVGPTASARR